jgi:hypothetical protein
MPLQTWQAEGTKRVVPIAARIDWPAVAIERHHAEAGANDDPVAAEVAGVGPGCRTDQNGGEKVEQRDPRADNGRCAATPAPTRVVHVEIVCAARSDVSTPDHSGEVAPTLQYSLRWRKGARPEPD